MNEVRRRHPAVSPFITIEIVAGFCYDLVGVKEPDLIEGQKIYDLVQLCNAVSPALKTDRRYLSKDRYRYT